MAYLGGIWLSPFDHKNQPRSYRKKIGKHSLDPHTFGKSPLVARHVKAPLLWNPPVDIVTPLGKGASDAGLAGEARALQK